MFTKDYTYEDYCNDLKTKHPVEHNFMIIGEAVARLPDDYKALHPDINWRQVKDFRNVIVHDYFGIDNSIVWTIIEAHLPQLAEDVVKLM